MSDKNPGEEVPPQEPGRPGRRFWISRRGASGQPAPGGFRARYARPGALVKVALAGGWRQYAANVVPLLLGSAIWLIPFFLFPAASLRVAPALGVGLWNQAGLLLVVAVVLAPIQVGLTHAALRAEAGERPRVVDFFRVPGWGRAVATGALVNIGVSIGFLLYILPGLAVGVWCIFAIVASVDRQVGPLRAVNASLELISKNPVAAMLLGVLVGVVVGVSFVLLPWLFLVLFLPSIVGAQVVALTAVNLYRTLEQAPSPR